MTAGVKVDMRVAEGLLKLLTGGHTPTAKKIFKRKAYQFAAAERDRLRGKVSVDKGRARKAVKARSTRGGGAQVYVDSKRAPHFHFPDSGTKDSKTKKGHARGRVKGKDYVKPWRARARDRYRTEIVLPLGEELISQIKKGLKA